MNFLAHFFTSRASDDLLSGSFVGDFVRGHVENHDVRFQDGIRLHRRVDTYTDSHPVVLELTSRLRSSCGRYAPVAIDIVFDHLLAQSWNEWSDQSLGDFVDHVHSILARDEGDYPQNAARFAAAMRRGDWLRSYATTEGITIALRNTSRRLKRPTDLTEAMPVVSENRREFDEKFRSFFRDLSNINLGRRV